MNINRITRNWAVPLNSSLHLIDTMSVSEAEKCGLISAQESEVIAIAFEQALKAALDEKGFATCVELQPISRSEIVRQFRRQTANLTMTANTT